MPAEQPGHFPIRGRHFSRRVFALAGENFIHDPAFLFAFHHEEYMPRRIDERVGKSDAPRLEFRHEILHHAARPLAEHLGAGKQRGRMAVRPQAEQEKIVPVARLAEIGGHQVALVRGYNGLLQQLVQEFQNDVLNTLPRYHEMTAVLDKVAAGELVARRQDMATNQLLSHALEQLLARSKRMRDTEAATMNMRLIGM